MPHMSEVLRDRAIGMQTAGLSTRAVARELNVNFSTISHLQHDFREFGNWPHSRRSGVWPLVGERFADVNVVNREPHGGSGVMVWCLLMSTL
jgi:hypothetical protein